MTQTATPACRCKQTADIFEWFYTVGPGAQKVPSRSSAEPTTRAGGQGQSSTTKGVDGKGRRRRARQSDQAAPAKPRKPRARKASSRVKRTAPVPKPHPARGRKLH